MSCSRAGSDTGETLEISLAPFLVNVIDWLGIRLGSMEEREYQKLLWDRKPPPQEDNGDKES